MSGPKVDVRPSPDGMETQYSATSPHERNHIAVFFDEEAGLTAYVDVFQRSMTPAELRSWARVFELAAQHLETGVQPELEKPAGES